jgi:ABC-type transport system involved in cytochrome bd biosynthesis fused ATPase/permease subunit
MDKGLMLINELKQKIKAVQKNQAQNNSKIADIIKAYKMLMIDISNFEKIDINLNEEKKKNLEAPQKRKKRKKDLITSMILAYIVTTLIALLVVLVGSAGTVSIAKCLLSSLVLFAPVCGIAIPIEFKSINKKYPISDNTKLEEQILSNNKNLESVYSKKNELDNELINLREKNSKLDEEISNLQKEIDSIVGIRINIIEEFCNNNPELDKKLDAAYEKSNIKIK